MSYDISNKMSYSTTNLVLSGNQDIKLFSLTNLKHTPNLFVYVLVLSSVSYIVTNEKSVYHISSS